MFLDHPRIAMAQLRRDHRERHAAHGKPARIGVAQPVKIRWRISLRHRTGRGERALLLGFGPRSTVLSQEHAGAARLKSRCPADERAPIPTPKRHCRYAIGSTADAPKLSHGGMAIGRQEIHADKTFPA